MSRPQIAHRLLKQALKLVPLSRHCAPAGIKAHFGPDLKLEFREQGMQAYGKLGACWFKIKAFPGFHSYTAPFCRRSGAKHPLVLQLLSARLSRISLLLAFQRWASGSMNSETEESR